MKKVLLASTALIGCAQAPKHAPQLIARCPAPAPLPAALLQIDLSPSTASLSKALQWSQSSEELLQSATPK